MEERPNYFAIIPANVRYDKNLNPNAKLLYGEITALSNKKGYCYATNEYFAELYNLSTRTITELVKKLEDSKYIFCEIETKRFEDGTVKKERKIYINHIEVLQQNHIEVFPQNHIEENFAYNNINNINNINNNNYTKPKSVKHKYGEYQNVLLTDDEYNKLKQKFNDNVTNVIKELDEGIELHGYKYKSHYLAILKWQEKRKLEQPSAPQQEEEETPEERAARFERNMQLWKSL